MSRVLAGLLGLSKEEVSSWINLLEHKAGYPSQDVRLLADKERQVREKISSLGLDADDTTGEELYHALVAKYDRDCRLVNQALDISNSLSPEQLEDIAVSLLKHTVSDSTVLAVKAPVLKKMLKDQPPKKTMKFWHYRSVDSLLKREDAAEVSLAALSNEAPSWHKRFNARLSRLKETDYSLQGARILKLDPDHYLAVKGLKTLSDARLGVVGLYPSEETNLQVLSIVLILAKEMEKICLRFEAKSLAAINPTLNWWVNTESLIAWNDGQPVSLNVRDVAAAHAESVEYGKQKTEHGAAALMTELLDSYKDHIDELPAELASINEKAGAEARKLFSPIGELALDAVEA